jgi:enterochelin esterase-like enzyme
MAVAVKTSRTQVWMESLGDWSWPGTGAAAVEVLPPAWVPAFPARSERVVTAPGAAQAHDSWRRRRIIARWAAWGVLLAALAVLCAALALEGPRSVERSLGIRPPARSTASGLTRADAAVAPQTPAASLSLPTLTPVSTDAAGSSIVAASYTSAALHGRGSFIVYLPPGYASTTRHYPVLYLLHGNDQLAGAFLEIGLQSELDRLIARHAIPPMIAVMIQGGRGANNWRPYDGHNYESYVVEVQELIDRALPTLPERGARAIAGDSMGGFGAMNIALNHPYRFSTVESWLGFFNGLEGQLRADRPVISRLGLHAFVYGGAEDDIADPTEDAPFAADLRASGAVAHGIVYPGGHTLETVEAHLPSMLVFAGRALARGSEPLRPAIVSR